jgi:hypothetical protein
VTPRIRFDVLPQGRIRVKDEEWLRLVKLEERAQRVKQRAELIDDADEEEADPNRRDVLDAPDPDVREEPTEAETEAEAEAEAGPAPRGDPGQGGLKLDLGGRRP